MLILCLFFHCIKQYKKQRKFNIAGENFAQQTIYHVRMRQSLVYWRYRSVRRMK